RRTLAATVLGVVLVVPMFTGGGRLDAGQNSKEVYRIHLNPAIERLSKGQPIIGFGAGDLSLGRCRQNARLDVDYVYVDMEHGPLNFDALANCVAAMTDPATALKTG